MDKDFDGFASSIINAFLEGKHEDLIDLMAHTDCVVAKFLGEVDTEDPMATKDVVLQLANLSKMFLSRSFATLEAIKHIAGLEAMQIENVKEGIRQAMANLEN